jgi:glycosyltransferase involved in cell wall biosynthesis
MDSEFSHVCFFGIYGHNQDEALRTGLAAQDVSVSEVQVPVRSVAEAKDARRLPIRTMRGTMAWFADAPRWAFPVLVLGALFVHVVSMVAVAVANHRTLREADALVVPHMGDTSVVVARPIASLLGVPLVYFSHNGLYLTLVENRGIYPETSVAGRLLKLLDVLTHRWSDAVVVFSAESADRFAETMGVPRSQYVVMYIKCVEVNFDVDPDSTIDPDVDVLYWGNFHPHHGPQAMVEAAAELPSYEFAFVGESDKRPPVQARADDLDASNVSFPGFLSLEALKRYILSADVVLGPVGANPQTEFTIGTKVAEAAYLEKAILVGDNPAINEVFEHQETAYLATPGDPDAIAAGVERIASDSDLQDRLEAGSREVYERYFSSERAGARLLEILEDVS